MNGNMLCSTTHEVAGKRIVKTIGLVRGNTIRARHLGHDFMAGLKTIVGGEIKGYTEMMVEARAQATQRMIDEARQLGADAVVNLRFTTSAVMQGMCELLAFGTAVKLSWNPDAAHHFDAASGLRCS